MCVYVLPVPGSVVCGVVLECEKIFTRPHIAGHYLLKDVAVGADDGR